ncbi:hypothetical protein HOI83_02785 [Candidatus Uhrbacteria bacterium]|jgi:hypothetical protein|nr:hypothetical protein [Candidatus Uhrbacteria bacterium]
MKSNWALALIVMLVASAVGIGNINVAEAAPTTWTDSDGDGVPDVHDACMNVGVQPGATVTLDGCSPDWGVCYLLQLQVGDSPDACGAMPKGHTFHQQKYAGELENTHHRIDKYGREVRVGLFGGVWDPVKNRFVQAEAGMYGYEGSGKFKDHKRLGATVLRGDSPVFWSHTSLPTVTRVTHPITKAEVEKLQRDAAGAEADMKEAKRAYDTMVRTRGADARELRDAKATLQTATTEYNVAAGKIAGFEVELGVVQADVIALTGRIETVELDVAGLKLAQERNRFYLELGYDFSYERWQGVLPGGLLLSVQPAHRFHLGAAHEYRTDRLTLRGVVLAGVNAQYDFDAVGATIGARIDAFYAVFSAVPWLRFGGSVGINVDWYHLGTGRTAEGVFSKSLSLRLALRPGVVIELPKKGSKDVAGPQTITVTAGLVTGVTYVGIHGINSPKSRGGFVGGIRWGVRFGKPPKNNQ